MLINTSVARASANGWYSEEDVEAYSFQSSRVAKRQLDFTFACSDSGGFGGTAHQLITEEYHNIPKECDELKPDDTVPAGGYKGLIHITVFGDPDRNKVMALYSFCVDQQTKKVRVQAKLG